MSILRILARSVQTQSGFRPLMTCRGVPIAREDLFAYTNGHFLVDEERQFQRRHVRFDVDALCHVAATAGGDNSHVVTIEKMEGGFNKAFLMKKANGTEVIAKIPCRIAGPPVLTTAGEVGVLTFVKRYTSIPVPRVLAWSSDGSNAVKAEYIIMEKSAGVPLYLRWAEMTELERLQLIKGLSQLEAQFSAIKFPCYGGLYLRTDRRQEDTPLDSDTDPSMAFCLGPSSDRSFEIDHRVDRGPWKSVASIGLSIARQEICKLSTLRPGIKPTFRTGTPEEGIKLLNLTMDLMPHLDKNPILGAACQPTLWHGDLHMGNIFVAPGNNAEITCLIDFQSIMVLPGFLQAQWPVFLKPPPNYDYQLGPTQPRLHDNLDKLDEQSKAHALRELSQAKLAKAYEISTLLENKVAHSAMTLPTVFRELFTRCGEVSEVGIVPLRACLIEMAANWSSLGFSGECPVHFTAKELTAHEDEFAEYRAWSEIQALAQQCLDTDAEGWIAPQLDIVEKRRQNAELMDLFVAEASKDRPAGVAKAMWPFPVE